jgi:hypothetical protein
MAARVTASADPAHPEGGHAVVLVQGIAAPPADARFHLQREGWGKGCLGADGWQVSEALLSPQRVEPVADGAMLFLGPRIVDALEAGPLLFRWPAAGIDAPIFWPDIAPLHGGFGSVVPDAPRPKPAPIAPRPPPAPPPDADADATVVLRAAPALMPAPASVPPPAPHLPARQGIAPLIVLVLLLLAAGGAGGWWWWQGQQPAAVAAAPETPPAPPAPVPAPDPPTPPPPAAAPPTLEALSVPEVLARAPSAAAIAEEAARRQGTGRHDDALLLWEGAARMGHAPALTALARLYDPIGFVANTPFRDPDPRQAARFYRDAEQAGDAEAAEPRARLRLWLEGQARGGDRNAPLTLQDFWP